MRTKGFILIGVIAIVCITAAAGLFLFNVPHYKNITMNEVTFEVPDSNATVTNQSEHFSIYNDTEKNVGIFVFDSEGSGLDDAGDMLSFTFIKETFQADAKLEQSNNFSYNYSDSLKTYSYLTNYTHKNVFIVTKNKEDMEHILSSVKVEISNNTTNETENSTNNTTVTKKVSKSTESSNNSSERKYGDYIDDEWVEMSEEEYAERYPALYHEEALSEGRYDEYHPEMYEVDRENGYI